MPGRPGMRRGAMGGGRRQTARRVSRRRRRGRRRRVGLVGGLVACGAYKMSTRDADRIEEYTGVPPEDLADQELDQAMTELNIPTETVDDTDREAASETGDASAAAPATSDPLDQIGKLADLHAQGILTDEEFEAKKTELLGEI